LGCVLDASDLFRAAGFFDKSLVVVGEGGLAYLLAELLSPQTFKSMRLNILQLKAWPADNTLRINILL
jgi:hypothetical protein